MDRQQEATLRIQAQQILAAQQAQQAQQQRAAQQAQQAQQQVAAHLAFRQALAQVAAAARPPAAPAPPPAAAQPADPSKQLLDVLQALASGIQLANAGRQQAAQQQAPARPPAPPAPPQPQQQQQQQQQPQPQAQQPQQQAQRPPQQVVTSGTRPAGLPHALSGQQLAALVALQQQQIQRLQALQALQKQQGQGQSQGQGAAAAGRAPPGRVPSGAALEAMARQLAQAQAAAQAAAAAAAAAAQEPSPDELDDADEGEVRDTFMVRGAAAGCPGCAVLAGRWALAPPALACPRAGARIPSSCTLQEYRPAKLAYGRPHPDPVVETASLAAVEPPDISYQLAVRCLGAVCGRPCGDGSNRAAPPAAASERSLFQTCARACSHATLRLLPPVSPARPTTSWWAACRRCSWRAWSTPASATSSACQTAHAAASSSVRRGGGIQLWGLRLVWNNLLPGAGREEQLRGCSEPCRRSHSQTDRAWLAASRCLRRCAGDGAGVGKGRTIAGLILENWRRGRHKHMCAGRDCSRLAGLRCCCAQQGLRLVCSPRTEHAPCARPTRLPHPPTPHPPPTHPPALPRALAFALLCSWVSVGADLKFDAERDLSDVGGEREPATWLPGCSGRRRRRCARRARQPRALARVEPPSPRSLVPQPPTCRCTR